jgi:hypothetical protein
MDQGGTGGSKGFDMSSITTGEKITLGGAALFLISTFAFNWYKVSVAGFGSATGSSRGGITFIAILFSIVAIVEIVLRRFFGNTMLQGQPIGKIHLGLAGGAVIIMILRIFIKPSVPAGLIGVSVSLTFSFFISLILSLVWGYGAFMMYSAPAEPSSMGGGGMGDSTMGGGGMTPPSPPPSTPPPTTPPS